MTPSSIIKLIALGVVAIIVLLLGAGSFYTVDEGERAVMLSGAKITGTSEPGIHFKLPFIDEARVISVRTQALEFKDEPVYTSDRQTATVTFSINYSALPGEVEEIYRNFGTLESLESRMITRPAKEQIKAVFGRFTADTAIRERGRLNTEVMQALGTIGDKLIRVEAVQIEGINFSDAVEVAAERRAQAEMAVQTKKQELEQTKVEAEITVTQAQAQADGRLAEARSRAEAIRIEGQAQADAIKAKGDALRESQNLIDLTKAERWNGILPTTMVPNATVPFLNVK